MPEIGDIIELIVDIPQRGLRYGRQGAIVHRHAPDAYEVEFTESDGTTEDFLALHTDQFIVVWRAETGKPVPVSEQISALVTRLPEDVATEVLDFARFLSAKKQVADHLSTPG